MERLNQLNEEVLTLWKDESMKLEMYIQWKMWERDALEVKDINLFYISKSILIFLFSGICTRYLPNWKCGPKS